MKTNAEVGQEVKVAEGPTHTTKVYTTHTIVAINKTKVTTEDGRSWSMKSGNEYGRNFDMFGSHLVGWNY